jgi:hypothetical protein
MPTVDLETFSKELLTEMLFYEENFGLVGTVSLVDMNAGKERYLGSFDPDEGAFILEEATAWAPVEDEAMEYELAMEGEIVETITDPGKMANELFTRAVSEHLTPHLQILYEDMG